MTTLADGINVIQLVGMIGWLPLLNVSQGNRALRQALEPHARSLLVTQLAECGLLLQPTTPLSIGTLMHLLYVLLLSPLLRYDNKALQNSWWHGPVTPAVECRVAIRHKRQYPPRRRWETAKGRRVQRENLQGIFPDNCFQLAVEQLGGHGENFRLLRHVETDVDGQGGYLMGVRIEVRTLYCTTKGFEVYLRWTFARDSDPGSSMYERQPIARKPGSLKSTEAPRTMFPGPADERHVANICPPIQTQIQIHVQVIDWYKFGIAKKGWSKDLYCILLIFYFCCSTGACSALGYAGGTCTDRRAS